MNVISNGFVAGTVIAEQDELKVQLDQAALQQAYTKLTEEVGELSLTLAEVTQRAKEAAEQEASRKKPPKLPKLPIPIFKVVIIVSYMYLDGALVVGVAAVVVDQRDG